MRIGHFQCGFSLGDFEANLSKVVEGVRRAEADRVEIVSFPECMLTGYSEFEDVSRRNALRLDGPEIRQLLDATRKFDQTIIVGMEERDGESEDLYITSFVARGGELIGRYRKATAYESFHKQGREFPVFRRGDLTFGVVICSDGGYVEPTRILAIKGARVIFAPHANYISAEHLINFFQKVRADHTARAAENDVYFLRGNSVSLGLEPGIKEPGVGYGDSYLIDPCGEIVVRSRRHVEDFIWADVSPQPGDRYLHRTLWSARELGAALAEAVKSANPETSRRASSGVM